MKLHPSQRHEFAERVCRAWIRRKGTRMASPKVYVIVHENPRADSWGWCHARRDGYITIHRSKGCNKRELYILLAHEFAHWWDHFSTVPSARRSIRPHGERFQRILWGVVPRGLWKRAMGPRFNRSSSRHRPEFQP